MQIGVLGRLQVLRDGAEVDLGSRKQRALLAGLTLHANEVVSVDRLTDLLWGERPPAAVAASLHGYVAALRRALEPDRHARAAATVLLTAPPSYRLQLPAPDLDAARFAAEAVEAHRRLASGNAVDVPAELSVPELEALLARFEAALALWRGVPYPELDGHRDVDVERARLEDLRLRAVQDSARVLLALERPGSAAATLGPLVSQHPLRKDLTALMALALARGGRQAEALQALRANRDTLSDELGLDPAPPLRDLELVILRQDVTAAPPARTVRAAASSATVSTATLGTAADSGGGSPTPVPSAPPLVGRDRELESLGELLELARSGSPQFAVVPGEAGIGKTRLASELSATAHQRGFLVLTGRCSSDEGAPRSGPGWAYCRPLLRRCRGGRTVAGFAARTVGLQCRRPVPALRPGDGRDQPGRRADSDTARIGRALG